jgi:hypothetical protein
MATGSLWFNQKHWKTSAAPLILRAQMLWMGHTNDPPDDGLSRGRFAPESLASRCHAPCIEELFAVVRRSLHQPPTHSKTSLSTTNVTSPFSSTVRRLVTWMSSVGPGPSDVMTVWPTKVMLWPSSTVPWTWST